MTQEEKARAYDHAIERARKLKEDPQSVFYEYSPKEGDTICDYIFPELRENDNEKIRKDIMVLVKDWWDRVNKDNISTKEQMIDWLENQGKETSWKPSKEEMDVLYGLAYITNQYDEHKESVITRLYQDLKREFFNGSSYENMFPTNTNAEDDVRCRSTIQVLEYARSLDTYNQYGKADIDKNIAWLEKQELKKLDNSVQFCKNSAKFKVGDWIVNNITKDVFLVKSINNGYYTLEDIKGNIVSPCLPPCESESHLWTIQDAKDGDVLASNNSIFIYQEEYIAEKPIAYCGIINGHFIKGENACWTNEKYYPATKEQRDLLFTKMEEVGYQWDDENKMLKKIEYAIADTSKPKFKINDWITDGEAVFHVIDYNIEHGYQLVTQSGTSFHFSDVNVDNKYHLWTIQDAKDGDVLTNGEIILIFKQFEEPAYREHIIAYIGLDINGNIQVTDGYWQLGDKASPATKEQRDLLFQEMKEAGYAFDFEKKELKKIEEDGVEYKKHITSELVNLAIAGVKQKSEPTWNNKDEEILKNLIDYFSLDDCLRLPTEETIDWLKSIKQRVQPQDFTITDEELAQAKKDAYNDALDKIEYHSGEPTFDDGWCGAIDYIRKKFIRPRNV